MNHWTRASDQKLHTCAFFSCQLTPAEHNYDVGNCELLTVKLALGEWRHWLEGVRTLSLFGPAIKTWHTFRLPSDSSQAHRTVFCPIKFSYTYRFQELQARCSLLKIYPEETLSPDTVIPPSSVVGAVKWETETTINRAQTTQHDPGNGPPGCLLSLIRCISRSFSGVPLPESPATQGPTINWSF